MTRNEVIKHLCETVGIVYHSIGDYSEPSDGICEDCPAQMNHLRTFQHSGHTLEFVRQAVIEKLKKDGYDVFDH